jgi:hypothetical protein
MQQLQAGLDLSQGPQILDGACGYYKLAARQNFIQGRRMDMVAAVCLYSFCRSQQPCRVMLIDFADQLQVCLFFFLPSLRVQMLTCAGQRFQAWPHFQSTEQSGQFNPIRIDARSTRGFDMAIRPQARLQDRN